jgi:hypothetical protein
MSGLTALKIDKRKPLASRHLLIWRAYQFFGHATLLPNPVFWEARGSEFSDKPLISLVGAAAATWSTQNSRATITIRNIPSPPRPA